MIYEVATKELNLLFDTNNNTLSCDSQDHYKFRLEGGSYTCVCSELTKENVKQLAQMFREIEIFLEKNSEDIG